MNATESPALIIAKTIAAQIGFNLLMCLGARDKQAMGAGGGIQGGYYFRFSNCRVLRSGSVMVALLPNDTYRVVIMNSRDAVVFTADSVYADQLAGILSEKIGA